MGLGLGDQSVVTQLTAGSDAMADAFALCLGPIGSEYNYQLPGTAEPLTLSGVTVRRVLAGGTEPAGVGIQLVRREGFAEAPVLEQALRRHSWHRLISRHQLQQGDWQLDQPLLPPTGTPLPDGGDHGAALRLQELAFGH